MREPIRFLDDPQTDESLLEVLKAAQPAPVLPEQAHAQLTSFAGGLAAHAVATKAALVGSGSKSLGSLLGFHGAGKALAVAAMMGALGTGSYVGVRYYVTHSTVSDASGSKRAGAQKALGPVMPASPESSERERLPAAVPEASVEPERSAIEVPAVRSTDARSVPPMAPSASNGQRGPASFEDLSIADEARLLERARALLATNPEEALEVANAHQRLYPAGQMSAEREFIAVDALMRLGRRTEAQQRAEPRLREFPDSLYARRLRKLLNN